MKYKNTTISILSILYLEIMFHLLVFKTFDYKDICYLLLFSILSSIFIDLITSLFTKKVNKWLYILINCFLN